MILDCEVDPADFTTLEKAELLLKLHGEYNFFQIAVRATRGPKVRPFHLTLAKLSETVGFRTYEPATKHYYATAKQLLRAVQKLVIEM